MSLGVGLLNGQAREKVYDVESGQKISQLNWSMKQVPTLHLGVKYQPINWLSLDLNGWTRVAKGDGHLKDYDWLEEDRGDWSHYSDHPDTQVSKAWQADFAATAWALKREDVALGVMLGYQRNQFGWSAKGGRYTYSSDEGFRDESGEFPAGRKAFPISRPTTRLMWGWSVSTISATGRWKAGSNTASGFGRGITIGIMSPALPTTVTTGTTAACKVWRLRSVTA